MQSNNLSIKVSIVIPVYNAESLLKRCLDSIYKQEGGFEIEVLAVDDGSTDNSINILNDYKQDLKIFEQSNKGPASARNIGIEKATGKYLAFLDADDYWKQGFLKTTIDFLELNSEAIAVNVAQIHKVPGIKDVIAPSFMKDNNQAKKSFVIDNFYFYWNEHKHICTGSVLIRTNIVKKSKGQLVDFRVSQDLEYWSYIGSLGKWGFIPKILFVSDGGEVTKKRGWLAKNKIRWNNTPSIEAFKERTLLNIEDSQKENFKKIIGWVSSNFTYNHIMAGNFKKARTLILKQHNNFSQSNLNSFYYISAKSGIFMFYIFASLLKCIQICRQLYFNLKIKK